MSDTEEAQRAIYRVIRAGQLRAQVLDRIAAQTLTVAEGEIAADWIDVALERANAGDPLAFDRCAVAIGSLGSSWVRATGSIAP